MLITHIVTFPLVFKYFTYKIFRFGHLKCEDGNKRVRVEDADKKRIYQTRDLKGMNTPAIVDYSE